MICLGDRQNYHSGQAIVNVILPFFYCKIFHERLFCLDSLIPRQASYE